MTMKNSIDTIEIRTNDLPAFSAVPQPIAPPRAPPCDWTLINLHGYDRACFKGEDIVEFRLGISIKGNNIYRHC